MSDETTINEAKLVLCVKHKGGLYQINSKSISVENDIISGRLVAVVDLNDGIKLFPEPICMVVEK